MLAHALFSKSTGFGGPLKSTKPIIWIIEDDNNCLFVYRDILEKIYELKTFKGIDSFCQMLAQGSYSKPDLIIADLRLRDGSFLDVLTQKTLTSFGLGAPLMVVSVLDDVQILESCFKNGARDYLTKPFNKNELLYKVSRLLDLREEKVVDAIKIDSLNMHVTRCGVTSEKLTLKEMQLLSFFLEDPEHRQSRKNLIRSLWKQDVSPQVLNVHLKNLRNKIASVGLFINFNGAQYILEKRAVEVSV